jgi:DNA-binding transcriptional ArsR family regulator
MEKTLWYLLTGMRGGQNRVRIVEALRERPRNANQLAETLELDYKTIRHHLDMLTDHDVVESRGDGYGETYFVTDQFEVHSDVFDRIKENVEDT